MPTSHRPRRDRAAELIQLDSSDSPAGDLAKRLLPW